MTNRFLSLLFFLLTCCSIFGQSEIRFQNFTNNDGLSQSSVLCLIQDDLNTIWVGTQDGLNRFDGHHFEVFTSNETEGLNSDYIRTAEKSPDGTLWFGTNDGLTKFDIKTEIFETFSNASKGSFHITDISVDENGKVWMTTTDQGVYTFNPKTKRFESLLSQIASKKTTNILVLASKVIVASEDLGISIYDKKTKRVVSKVLKDGSGNILGINTIRKWKDREFLIATNHGAFSIDIDRLTVKQWISNLKEVETMNVSDVISTGENKWLVTTKGEGLFLIENDKTYKQYTEDIFQKNALLINELNVLFRDNSGNVWIGSQRGLSGFDPAYDGIYGYGPSGTESKGIPTPNVWSFAESKDGRHTYIGTDRAVSRWDRKTGVYRQFYRTKEHSTTGTGEMAVLSLFAISNDFLLVGCGDGIFELKITPYDYSFEQIQEKGDESSLKHKRGYSIVHWKDSKFFIATKDGVILYDSKNKSVLSFEHDPQKPKETIAEGICRVAYKDNSGNIWFATSSGGLSILSTEEDTVKIIPYQYNHRLIKASNNYITSIFKDEKGNLWLTTFGSGLIKWNEKEKSLKVFNRSNGLPNDAIYGLVDDSNGNLWLSTNKGLCSFSPKTKKTRVFTEQQGLMSNEFNLGAFMKSANGFLYFGGIYGFNYFDPSKLGTNRSDIRIRFSKFKLENEWLTAEEEDSPLEKPIFLTKDLYLGYRNNSFTLKFQPSNLGNGETINYKYHLIGSDEGEIMLGSQNEIHFNALAPGDYELLIYARRGNGAWSSVPASLNIHISIPFWRTWWFWTIIGLVLAFLMRLIIKRRVEASHREQVRLEIKVRNRTKEIQQQNQKIAAQKLKIEDERNKVIKQQKLLQIEKDKTEKLLKNVIPASTAEELKKRGKARARAYKTVSVLFTDFVGFTHISDRMSATELVKKLDVYFTKFDQIIVKNNLEKIKTIGDAYMCAGGVPVRNNTNPIDTCIAALQIQDYMLKRKNDAVANGKEYWELRLGINTGEVTAGVIGSERLAYDVWGATVNQAQRMEMMGTPGQVTITGATYQLIEPYFECVFKGKAQTKSRGVIDMYQVVRIKPELSINGEGVEPNARFQEIVNLHLYSSINYYKAERYIMKLLDQQLSPTLHYHSVGHSKDVVTAVERIALLENVTDEGLFLLKSAANYHDAGFIEQYDANEPIGARLAGEILPRFGYTAEHITKIKELIFATKIPHKPKNKLEEIICDADLDYLGRDDFHEIADRLRRELREHGKINSDRQWDEIQVGFLKMHQYFTETAKESRRPKKLQHLKEVEERLKRNDYVD